MDEARNNQDEVSPEQIVSELRATFREEAYELLAELESALLELERTPGDKEQIGRAFRCLHTIKGSGGACEFHDVAAFTHELETVFDKIRNGRAVATKEVIDLTLSARDQIGDLFDRYYKGGSVDEDKGAGIIAQLLALVPGDGEPRKKAAVPAPAGERGSGRTVTYRIRFRPDEKLLVQGTDPLLLLDELRELGPCRVVAQSETIPNLEDFDPLACYTYWDVILTTGRGMNAIQDVFIFVKDTSDVSIDVIDEEGLVDADATYKKLGEILLERGDLTTADLQKILNAKKKVGEMLVDTGVVAPSKVESALIEQQHVRAMRVKRQSVDAASSIRVAVDKLDSLVDLVGELVTMQARLNQTALSIGNADLMTIAEEVERLTGSLRENAMNIRMLPIGTTFSKFKRLVRDLSVELGKEIELTTSGAETELDKTVIERLSDPLVHIIRNCIDHGIEPPATREASGKPRTGTIHLSAVHSGAHVLISVRDDGAGMDAGAIRAKAVEKGLVHPDAELTERQQWELILAPGFSTARTVTGVSGRGVGMDVVKRAIDALRGVLEIESRQGVGTTITLRLPLTLAIIDGFLTRILDQHFIFPLSLVEECVELVPEDAAKSHGRRLAHVRGEIVPYIKLRDHFLINGTLPQFEQIVITNVDGKRVGLVVDTVVGEHQTVLKSLGKFYSEQEGISGATILGNGTVALILDIPKLVRLVERQEAQLARGGEPA
jgi:two-component system chemotaxis sensor kinase CheA